MSIEKKKKVLEHRIRKRVYYIILKYPGVHFNELLRKGKLASGQLTHHLSTLEKNDLIYKVEGKVVNYYAYANHSKDESHYTKYLRDDRKRTIIKLILEKKIVSFADFKKKLNLSNSTISWHLKELVDRHVILEKRDRKKKYYCLSNEIETLFNGLLQKEKRGVLSNIVNSFIDLWEQDF